MVITFDELRRIKDHLPDGSIHRIAEDLGLKEETVRNYFGGYNFTDGQPMGVHFEKGANGGVVRIEDERILDYAYKLLDEKHIEIHH